MISRGGVGAENLRLTLASNPIGLQPEAVVLSSFESHFNWPLALQRRNSDDFSMPDSSDKQEAICFFANSKPFPWGFLKHMRAW